jgi:hypothetical protein
MHVDANVRRAAAKFTDDDLSLRVTANLPVEHLLRLVVAAIDDLTLSWDLHEPPGLRANLPPEVIPSVVPPDVIITLRKDSDPLVSVERLTAALERALPSETRLTVLKPTRLPGDRATDPVLFLELRMALIGERRGHEWSVDPEIEAAADSTLVEWLRAFGPTPAVHISLPSGHYTPIQAGTELQTLSAERPARFATLTAAIGDQFRSLGRWFPTGHISAITGTASPTDFAWQAAADELLAVLRTLEPWVQTAFIHCSDNFGATCSGAHARRQLDTIPNRYPLRTGIERSLEEKGLVDAQGVAFLSKRPAGLSDDWALTPFGHLTQIAAPNLDDWLAHPPTTETVAQGRTALAPLLDEPTSFEM